MSEEPKTDPRLAVALQRHDSRLTFRGLLLAAGSVGSTVIAGFLYLNNYVAAQTDAGVKVLVQRVEVLEANATEQRKENAATREEVREMRGELRELYSTVRTGRRSEALERPVPPLDGGR